MDVIEAMADDCLTRFRKELLDLKEINYELTAKLKTEQDANNKKYKMYEERVDGLKAHLAAQAKLLVSAQNELTKLIELGENMSKGLVHEVGPCLEARSQSLGPNVSLATPSSSGIGGQPRLKKPFSCPVSGCAQQFLNKRGVKQHVLQHSDHKLVVCEFRGCNRWVPNKCVLKLHMRQHTREKPFECRVLDCNKKFAKKVALKRHMSYHNGNRPFECTFNDCGQKFVEKKGLVRHTQRHYGVQPYPCRLEGCRRTFSHKYLLQRHWQKHNAESSSTSLKTLE